MVTGRQPLIALEQCAQNAGGLGVATIPGISQRVPRRRVDEDSRA